MSKQANPAVIGGFVLGALVLLIIGIVVFGSGKFFTTTTTYVVYFDENIKGLNVGAPVNFRGTRIGTVTGIKVLVDELDASVRTPVYMTLEGDRIQKSQQKPIALLPPSQGQTSELAQRLIQEKGLRAQLQSQSLVTGQLVIELNFHPDSPIHLHNFPDPHPEFPTVPSLTHEIASTIEDLKLDELVNAAMGALKGFEQLANSPDVRNSLLNLNVAMESIKNVTKSLDAGFGEFRTDVGNFLESGQSTLAQAEKTLAMKEGPPARLMVRLEETTKAAENALKQAQRAMKAAEDAVGENSTLRYELANTLKELSSAARSIRVMADYLEQHPEALIHGKGSGRQ